MTRQYLKATGQDAEAISKDKLTPKGGLVEEASEEAVEEVSDTPKKENSKEKEE